jgi:hypothetical protein
LAHLPGVLFPMRLPLWQMLPGRTPDATVPTTLLKP